MNTELLFSLFGIVSAIGFAAMYLLSFQRKYPIGLGERSGASRKSNWIRAKAAQWIRRRWLRWASLPLGVLSVFIGWWGLLLLYGFMGLSVLATRRYQKHLHRQWELWQQLGYDGPPELEEQARQLNNH